MSLTELKKNLRALADPQKAKDCAWFFKTGPGEYGEGDVFLGVTVPNTRKVARTHRTLSLKDLQKLLDSKYHEERLIALMILRMQYERAPEEEQKPLIDFYLNNTHRINNWDLVDLSVHYILGNYLKERDRKILYKLTKSKSLWERRMAIISTFAFIDEGQFEDALKLAEILKDDSHDLIHKAVGWVLREIGNRDQTAEEKFLKKHYQKMPRTMLRYAIEKFPEPRRKAYLKGTI